jgi:hypothetical protein
MKLGVRLHAAQRTEGLYDIYVSNVCNLNKKGKYLIVHRAN